MAIPSQVRMHRVQVQGISRFCRRAIATVSCAWMGTIISMAETSSAATLSANSDPTVVVLFAGRGEELDEPLGLNKLNGLLQRRFGDTPETPFFSQVFRYTQGSAARNYLSQFPTVKSLGIIGYSWGGDTAIDLANDLDLVNLLVQIDSVGRPIGIGDGVLPASVQKGINYYQRNPSVPGGSFFRRLEEFAVTQLVEKNVRGSENINVETLFNDSTITHLDIDDDRRLHRQIAANVKEFLFSDIPPSLQATAIAPAIAGLTLQEDAPLDVTFDAVISTSALSSLSTLSSTVSQEEPATVPESGMSWSWIGPGVFGVGLAWRRDRHQRSKQVI